LSKLFVIPTPIGNLEDITFRAINTLKKVDVILVEDTRKTGILLKHYKIKTKLKILNQVNEHAVLNKIIEEIKLDKKMALVSDSGTPSISDPGYLLITECIKNNLSIECLPGATAFIPALVCSGIPSDRFFFEGFLPRKKGRKKRLLELSELTKTIIIYESPKRLVKLLTELIFYFEEDRYACVSREISKIYEEHKRGTLTQLLKHFQNETVKGEITITIKAK